MPGYRPAFVYPFAGNSLLCLTQILASIYGYKLSNRTKIQVSFLISAVIIFSLPWVANYGGSPGQKYYIVMALIIINGIMVGLA